MCVLHMFYMCVFMYVCALYTYILQLLIKVILHGDCVHSIPQIAREKCRGKCGLPPLAVGQQYPKDRYQNNTCQHHCSWLPTRTWLSDPITEDNIHNGHRSWRNFTLPRKLHPRWLISIVSEALCRLLGGKSVIISPTQVGVLRTTITSSKKVISIGTIVV